MFHFKWPIRQWLVQRKAIYLCRKLYHNVPSFTLAQKARELQQQFSYEYIYGEIDFSSFSQLLSYCEMTPETIFYDLGSGSGKAVMCAALLYDFKKVCGIEHLELLHNCAQNISKQLANKNIYLYQADLLTFDWQEADILFINASAFIGDFWQQVLSQLKQLKAGTQIIIVTKLLPEDYFTPIFNDTLLMSWGWARVGVWRRKA